MSKEKREEQVKVINSLLELKRKVVGVKFYYDEEEYEACPAQQVKYYIPYCVTVRCATAGHDIKIRKWCTLFWIFNVDYRRDLSDFGYTGMYK